MKTKIITLESHDNLVSVRDKLSWAKTPRILLVWPKFESVSLRYLDLKVLQRHAASLGAQLGLVTRIHVVRREALAMGIPVFESTGVAQRANWPENSTKKRIDIRDVHAHGKDLRKLRITVISSKASSLAMPAVRVFSFSMAVLAILVLAAIFVPRAEISIYPETQMQRVEIPVVADPKLNSISLTGEIPARLLLLELSSDKTLEVNHLISTPESKSEGKARFTNLTQTELEIPAGTFVRTLDDQPMRYQTLHATLIPGGPDQFVEVPIEALSAGMQANVGADLIKGIEGSLSLSAIVTNPEPTHGGTDLQATGANLDDRELLRSSLLEQMRENATQTMKDELDVGNHLLEGTIVVKEVLQEEFDPPAGRAGSPLRLHMQASFSGYYLLEEDLQSLAASSLSISQPPGYTSFNQPIQVTTSNLQKDESGIFHLTLETSRKIVREVDALAIREAVRGRPVDEVRTLLVGSWAGRAPAEVYLTPGWWPWLPLNPFNLTILVK